MNFVKLKSICFEFTFPFSCAKTGISHSHSAHPLGKQRTVLRYWYGSKPSKIFYPRFGVFFTVPTAYPSSENFLALRHQYRSTLVIREKFVNSLSRFEVQYLEFGSSRKRVSYLF